MGGGRAQRGTKSALLEMLQRFGEGDPRAKPARWRTVMDKAPGAYAVLMRWLTRASVLQFLDIVDRLMPDSAAKLMWAYRRAFWMSYLLSDGNAPGIDAAWVAFGDEGERLAKRAARESGTARLLPSASNMTNLRSTLP